MLPCNFMVTNVAIFRPQFCFGFVCVFMYQLLHFELFEVFHGMWDFLKLCILCDTSAGGRCAVGKTLCLEKGMVWLTCIWRRCQVLTTMDCDGKTSWRGPNLWYMVGWTVLWWSRFNSTWCRDLHLLFHMHVYELERVHLMCRVRLVRSHPECDTLA